MEKDKIVFWPVWIESFEQDRAISFAQTIAGPIGLPVVGQTTTRITVKTLDSVDVDLHSGCLLYIGNVTPHQIIKHVVSNLTLCLLSEDKQLRELAELLCKWKDENLSEKTNKDIVQHRELEDGSNV